MAEYMTPAEVGRILRSDPKTVTRWILSGRWPKIDPVTGETTYLCTPGGRRRILAGTVRRILSGEITFESQWRRATADRRHAGLGLPCEVCPGPCEIDEVNAA